MQALVGVIMGSKSDWETLSHTTATLEALGVPFEVRVVSAHRTPDLLFEYASSAESRGLEVIIAGGGRRGPPAWNDCSEDGPARAGRAGGIAIAEGLGFIAVDRTDAGRRSGRDVCDRYLGGG